MSTKEASWFKNKKKEKNMYQWNCRYRNEQHILVSFLKKKNKFTARAPNFC